MVKYKNILITGSKGQLGRSIKDISDDFRYNYFFMNKSNLDITDSPKLEKFLIHNDINIIINCAAYTDVERAEIDTNHAIKINDKAVGSMVKLCSKLGIQLIHISTDYIFDGKKRSAYIETDYVKPLNNYGLTKLAAENKILNTGIKDSIIIRTSVLYYENGKSFINNIIDKILNGKNIKVVNDQFSTPTYAGDLARVILKIIPFIKCDGAEIYHFANKGECTRFDIADKINKFLKGNSVIGSIKTNNKKTVRPLYSVLESTKIIEKFDLKIRNWEDALEDYLKRQKINLNEI